MIEIFEQSQTLYGFIGILISASLWAVRRAFMAQGDIFKKEVDLLKEQMAKLSEMPNRIWQIHTDFQVHKAESSGVLNRIEAILKEQAQAAKISEMRLAQMETGLARARKVRKKQKGVNENGN